MSGRLARVGQWEKVARKAGFQPAVMAALCAVSLRQMERFFVLRFEQTPREWVSEFRCRLARELISQGWSNRAVALELGFANESHFCHEFKRLCGVSPQSFALGFELAPQTLGYAAPLLIGKPSQPVQELAKSASVPAE